MSDTRASTEPERYEIRLKGQLDERWSGWFEDLHVTTSNDGTTVLVGTMVDQAALYGVLRKIRDLGLPLISVNVIETDNTEK